MRWVLLLVVACSAPAHPVPPEPRADLVLEHGRVLLAIVPEQPGKWTTDAIAIREDTIIAIGDDAKKVAAARRIDLGGRIVIPGLHDHHVHEPSLFSAYEVPGSEDDTQEQTVQQIEKAVHDVAPGTWLHAVLGTPTLDELADSYDTHPVGDSNGHLLRAPSVAPLDRSELDRVAPANPVWLDNGTGHVAVLNSAAEKVLALDALPRGSFKGPEGWYYEYGRYAAMRKRGAVATDAQVTAAIESFETDAVSFGITSVTAFPLDIDAARLAKILVATPRKIHWLLVRTPIGAVETTTPALPLDGPGLPHVIVAGLKYFIDGMQVERGAALTKPYEGTVKGDPLEKGRLDWTVDEIRKMLEVARANNTTLHLHVVGDRALDVVFREMEQLGGDWSRLVVIEHGHLLTDIARAKKLGVTFIQNPFHSEMADLNKQRLGERVRDWQPLKSMRAADIPMAFGSDGPLDPFRNIQLAEQHPTNPTQALTRDQALALYLRWEAPPPSPVQLGPGQRADLAVLSGEVDDPATRSVLTIVDGVVVHDTLSPASGPSSARME